MLKLCNGTPLCSIASQLPGQASGRCPELCGTAPRKRDCTLYPTIQYAHHGEW